MAHPLITTQNDSHSCPMFGVGSYSGTNEAKSQHFPQSRQKGLAHPSSGMGPCCTNVPSRLPSNSLCPNERSLNNGEKHYEVKIDRWYSIFMPACLLRICVCPQIAWWLSCVYVWVCMCVWRQDLSGGFILAGNSVLALSERGNSVREQVLLWCGLNVLPACFGVTFALYLN